MAEVVVRVLAGFFAVTLVLMLADLAWRRYRGRRMEEQMNPERAGFDALEDLWRRS